MKVNDGNCVMSPVALKTFPSLASSSESAFSVSGVAPTIFPPAALKETEEEKVRSPEKHNIRVSARI